MEMVNKCLWWKCHILSQSYYLLSILLLFVLVYVSKYIIILLWIDFYLRCCLSVFFCRRREISCLPLPQVYTAPPFFCRSSEKGLSQSLLMAVSSVALLGQAGITQYSSFSVGLTSHSKMLSTSVCAAASDKISLCLMAEEYTLCDIPSRWNLKSTAHQ